MIVRHIGPSHMARGAEQVRCLARAAQLLIEIEEFKENRDLGYVTEEDFSETSMTETAISKRQGKNAQKPKRKIMIRA